MLAGEEGREDHDHCGEGSADEQTEPNQCLERSEPASGASLKGSKERILRTYPPFGYCGEARRHIAEWQPEGIDGEERCSYKDAERKAGLREELVSRDGGVAAPDLVSLNSGDKPRPEPFLVNPGSQE